MPRHPTGQTRAAALLLLLLAAALPLRAAFFMRWRGSDGALLEQLGGRTVYRATARVNGAPARLQVLDFDRPAAELATELARTWELPPAAAAAGACITRLRDGRLTRVLLLPGADAGRCTAWLTEQRLSDLPPPGQLPAPPVPFPHPAAQLTFWSVNDRTRTQLAVGEAADAPAAAHGVVDAQLRAAGWAPLLAGQPGSLAVYGRQGRACVVWLSPGDTPGATRIAVLQQGAASP